jgi:hypothetical protein
MSALTVGGVFASLPRFRQAHGGVVLPISKVQLTVTRIAKLLVVFAVSPIFPTHVGVFKAAFSRATVLAHTRLRKVAPQP